MVGQSESWKTAESGYRRYSQVKEIGELMAEVMGRISEFVS